MHWYSCSSTEWQRQVKKGDTVGAGPQKLAGNGIYQGQRLLCSKVKHAHKLPTQRTVTGVTAQSA